MNMQQEVMEIVFKAFEGTAPDKTECAFLLGLPEDSIETGYTKVAADRISRDRFGNRGILLGQIGVEIAPCPGQCNFCAFGEKHTQFTPSRMPDEEILSRAKAFTDKGDLFALFLMTMHTFDFEWFLKVVSMVRKSIPPQTQIVANVGDFTESQAREMKAAGVNGAYHVLRLREGKDTTLAPAKRVATIDAVRSAGLDFYYCCEPVGPEHTPEEMAEQIFVGIEHGCFQHAAMRRVYVPSSPLASLGQITERRLAQIVAVVTLAASNVKETRSIAVHEPNLLGLAAGANTLYAETGANPRDTEADTTGHRGHDMDACRQMLYESGYASLLLGDGSSRTLNHLNTRE